jgi:hypothetical protein
LLLGGVLKGQELIENAKVKNAVNDVNGVTAAYNGYLDRFKRLPGDDGPTATLSARGGAWAPTPALAAGDNNGILAITAAQAFAGGGEGPAFWQHLKASGFIAGNPADAGVAALPRNAFNGLMSVFNNAATAGPPATTAVTGAPAGLVVCLGQVPGKAARQLDVQLDDGVVGTGSVRATLGLVGTNTVPGAAAVAAYNDNEQYTVCKTL